MKTAQEFFYRLRNDMDFANQITEAFKAKRSEGAKSYSEALIPIAAEAGYELTAEDVDAVIAKNSEEISDEELGKISGGFFSCLTVVVSVVISAAVSTQTLK